MVLVAKEVLKELLKLRLKFDLMLFLSLFLARGGLGSDAAYYCEVVCEVVVEGCWNLTFLSGMICFLLCWWLWSG